MTKETTAKKTTAKKKTKKKDSEISSTEISSAEKSSKIDASKIDDLRNEEKKSAQDAEKKPRKKRGRKKKKKGTAFSSESMKHLLRLPFSIGGMLTGFSYDPIQPPIDQPLAESAVVVAEEFGLDYLEKWGNLAVFVALYGTCAANWMSEFKKFKAEQETLSIPVPPEINADGKPEKPGNEPAGV